MTNRKLVQRFNAVQQAIQRDAFHTTKINYALSQNHKRLERALEGFQEQEEQLREEYVDLLDRAQTVADGGSVPDDLSEEDHEAWEEYPDRRDELLDIEADEDVTPYQVETEYLLEHEQNADAQWLTMLDWMFVEDVE